MNEKNERQADDEQLVRRARALFEDSVAGLDAATCSDLNRRRHAALESAHVKSTGFRALPWLPASGVAAAAVLAVLLINGNEVTKLPVPPSSAADVEILLDGDDLEMFGDLEFYSWIELAPESASHVG